MRPGNWLDRDYGAEAAQRLLDAAGELFAERGVAAVGMADVAQAAGCSRATLYRYFASRTELRTAFVHREARRVGAAVATELADVTDPHERVLTGVQAALRRVRLDPTMSSWFRADAGGIGMSLGQSSPVIETIVGGFLGENAGEHAQRRARWMVRMIVSLLAMPGTDPADERELLERFVRAVLDDAADDADDEPSRRSGRRG
ncbi:MAG TPA: helix-turn-helix domain-containing protein [Jatrophihabitantaceae bacterium]|nr:helix-turn-helix domain-containing protein [Jatrophihabitantaceae bacterium]